MLCFTYRKFIKKNTDFSVLFTDFITCRILNRTFNSRQIYQFIFCSDDIYISLLSLENPIVPIYNSYNSNNVRKGILQQYARV